MFESLTTLSPVLLALLATLFTWGVTALGAASVFMPFNMSQRMLDAILGFAGGVMMAASFWSLLAPSIEMSEAMGMIPWLPPLIGFLLGGACLRGIDFILPHLHVATPAPNLEGVKTSWQRSILLSLAITLHNIPEGLAVGVAFGAVGMGIESATIAGAVALALGIGLQNFPEGIAVAMPLRREGMTRWRSFLYGQLSALVEPVAGVIGAAAVVAARPLLPFALSFAAGAMIFVVVEDVIPEAYSGGHVDAATMGVLIGFAVMMTLDVALG
jgi:ZIP family zinc transporter